MGRRRPAVTGFESGRSAPEFRWKHGLYKFALSQKAQGGFFPVRGKNAMRIAVILVSCLLWLWFLGAIITWRFGTVLLVEGMGVKSAEFFMLCLFSIAFAAYLLFPPTGQWVLLIVLAFWLVVQFFCHEYFTFFGASPQKLKGYNECFSGTAKLFPAREDRLIPDFYHIVLHLLIAADLILVMISF